MKDHQGELDFGASRPGGFEAWHQEQLRWRQEFARSVGLPLGQPVEIWLRGGIRLRGPLRLAEAMLVHAQSTLENTRFEIKGVTFLYGEMESCVVLA